MECRGTANKLGEKATARNIGKLSGREKLSFSSKSQKLNSEVRFERCLFVGRKIIFRDGKSHLNFSQEKEVSHRNCGLLKAMQSKILLGKLYNDQSCTFSKRPLLYIRSFSERLI